MYGKWAKTTARRNEIDNHSLLEVLNTAYPVVSTASTDPRRYRERPVDSVAFDGRVGKKDLSMANI